MKKLVFPLDLDVISKIIFFAALSLLYLPDWGLMTFTVFLFVSLLFLLILIYAYVKHYLRLIKLCHLLIVLLTSLFYFHSNALNLLNIGDQVNRIDSSQPIDIQIIKIFKQTSYQTVLAKIRSDNILNGQNIYLNWKDDHRILVGEIWTTKIKLRPISSRLNFGGFDKQKWYLSQGIVAYGKVKSAVKKKNIFSWREKQLNLALEKTAHLSSQGLLMALGFGERAWLDHNTWQAYQKTNTAHLIAISGLHIGLAMLIGFSLARLGQFFLPTNKITPLLPIITGLVFASFYAYLAGFSIPTLRGILALILIYCFHLWRLYLSVWQLFFRVIAILCVIDPLMLLSSSFWLSVNAVFCLIIWYKFIPLSLFQWKNESITYVFGNKVRYILGLFHLQIGLLWLFTPVQLFFFQGISSVSFIANLIVVPLFSLCIVPIILFAVFSNGLWHSWEIADWLLVKTNNIIFSLKENWITVNNEWSYFISLILILLFFLFIYWIYFSKNNILDEHRPSFYHKGFPLSLNEKRSLPKREWQIGKYIGSVGLFLYLGYMIKLFFLQPLWHLETMDIGQGLATLIVKDKRAILYDTGAGWKTGSMARAEIIPYLQREGIQLEKLFVSHDDNDHSGGVKDILQQYPNIEVITTSTKKYSENNPKFNRSFCKRGKKWHWYGLSLIALSPEKIVKRSKNEDSCVLLVTDNKHKILLTGDVTIEIEKKILSSIGQIDILQVGHHGSKTSTSQFFVEHIQPKVALISSGRWNLWHFPHQSVIKNLQTQNSLIFNTAHSGQINIHFYETSFSIEQARHKFSPWFSGLIGIDRYLRLQ
ncbi:competence protein ComEC [Bisgaardia hudsonensis]|uniref:Competence protein ComEC n=1 Tax=Bisgaardia hudsonensis TaxID=109472 RepID=A0A4R2N059_9PAST|nr:DNA internalization-related competence protein ComEC/Rec2 [Bisgaardia hudsonensis]QLB13323.1 DNA internalization-related competence protein ComEC/Rec2 [Bisgaardia hudsonensis]TCP12723.1 competence protein ComEC [Bisgaardia hudsonensis]